MAGGMRWQEAGRPGGWSATYLSCCDRGHEMPLHMNHSPYAAGTKEYSATRDHER